MSNNIREKEILKIFHQYDVNSDGKLDKLEFKNFLEEVYGSKTDDKTCEALFTIVDQNKNGSIEFDEFRNWLQNTKVNNLEKEKELYKELFHKLDANKDGHLDQEEFHHFLAVMVDPDISPSMAKITFQAVDTDKNGTVEFEEFYEWLHNARKSKAQDRPKKKRDDAFLMCFRAMDSKNLGKLDYEDFKKGVSEVLKVNLDEEELKKTFELFDANHNGFLELNEWMDAMNNFLKKD